MGIASPLTLPSSPTHNTGNKNSDPWKSSNLTQSPQEWNMLVLFNSGRNLSDAPESTGLHVWL